MSLLIEMFILLALAGLLGGFLGWLLHGNCDEMDENVDNIIDEGVVS